MQSPQERLDHAFELPEIAAAEESQPGRLVGERPVSEGKIDMGSFKQFRIKIAVGLVVAAHRQQAGNQALPQRNLPFPAGVLDSQRRSSGAGANRQTQGLVDQTERHRLAQPQARQHAANLGFNPFPRTAGRW